jgi:hypothetical protein
MFPAEKREEDTPMDEEDPTQHMDFLPVVSLYLGFRL